jgi:TatD DNase family protein
MIDTHAHLHFKDYQSDRDRVITRDFAIGISAIVEVNLSRRDWPDLRRLIEADPRIVGTVGIHAHEARRESAADLDALEPQLAHPKVVAVGETGIDTYRDYAPIENQRALFAAHVRLARRSGLPLVVHCREAFDEVFAILDDEGGGEVRGVFHCFSGTAAEAAATLERGFRIGLGGSVTYAPDRWAPLLQTLPLESLLLETDCPFLKPAPERKGRNEPAWVFRVAEAIAAMRGMDTDLLIDRADANAVALFGPRLAAAAGIEEVK